MSKRRSTLITEIKRKELEFDAEFERLLKEFSTEMLEYKSGVKFAMETRYLNNEKAKSIISEMNMQSFAKQAFADKATKIAGGISFLQQAQDIFEV